MKSLAIGLSPNTQMDDILTAIGQILLPFSYQRGYATKKLEKWFEKTFDSYAYAASSGRAALYTILQALAIGPGDEVIMQAFSCIVVANAITATGAKVVYVDVANDLTIDAKDLTKKITKHTKAIIVQHTFGIASDMDTIIKTAHTHKIPIIEDVAHTIGGEYKNKKLGTLGTAAFFSLGRDKAFSSVFGGMIITKDTDFAKKIVDLKEKMTYPSHLWIVQQLLHPIICSIALSIYDVGNIGKLILVLAQRMHLLSFPVSTKEKSGMFDLNTMHKLPNALAVLALHQLEKIEGYNKKRKQLVAKYTTIAKELDITYIASSNPLLRFPLFVPDPQNMRNYFRKRYIYLGDWYGHVIDPKNSNMQAIGYKKGMCTNAENLAARVINLPTLPNMTDNDIKRVVDTLRAYVTNQENNQ